MREKTMNRRGWIGGLTSLAIAAAWVVIPLGTAVADETDQVTEEVPVVVCQNNSVSTTDEDGEPLDEARLEQIVAEVQQICDEQQAEDPEDSSDESVTPFAAKTYYNVRALITYRGSTMGINGYANSLPYAKYSLSCIYRAEPVSGAAAAWQSCGAVTGKATSLTTSTVLFCPTPGTRFHARATLYNGSGSQLTYDDEWKIAA